MNENDAIYYSGGVGDGKALDGVEGNQVLGGSGMLEIRNITKIYRSKTGEEVRALDDVSIQFPESGMVFLLGKSGSGKSTLLNVIGGLDGYDSGEFVIKGKSSKEFVGSDFDAYRNTFIGFIFQEYNILDDFTVGANIALALELQGKKASSRAVEEILAQVDLVGYAHRKPNELSGGQKQRVAIARALVKDPQIIMADEPTGALDSNTGKQIFDALKALSSEKLVIVVSHDRDFAEKYADRIIELSDGRVIEDVTKHERSAERLSDGVHRVNSHILRIESGYRLTMRDLEMINAYLANNKGDVLLSGDPRVNDELRAAVGISREGASTVFEGTRADRDIKTRKYDKRDTKFIRSRLPMKNALKMGSSGLKHKKFRLFMTILLSFIAFAMFGLSNSMAAYEKVNAATNSIIDSQIRSAALTMGVRRTTTYDDGDSYTWHETHAFNEQDIEKLRAETGLDFLPVFTGTQYADRWNTDFGFNISHMFKQYESNTVYTGRISGLICMQPSQLPADYQVTGRLPEKKGEIAITELMYRQFQKYGYTFDGTTIEGNALTLGDNGANDIIGKKISFRQIGWSNLGEANAYELTIVGVVNTNFNYDRYASLMPADSTDVQNNTAQQEPTLMDMFLQNEIKYERDFGFHGMGFAHKDDVDALSAYVGAFMGGGSSIGEHMNGLNAQLYLTLYKPAENDVDAPEKKGQYYQVAQSSAMSHLDHIAFEGTPKTELAANEALLSLAQLSDILQSREMSMDLAAIEAAATQIPGVSPSKYQENKNNGNAPMYAMERAYMADYIQTKLADPAVLAQVQADAGGESAQDYWERMWIYSADEGYCPQVSGVVSKHQLQMQLYGNEGLQNALLAAYGIARPANMNAGGTMILANELGYGTHQRNYSSVISIFSRFSLANFIVENGYHLAENYQTEFVQKMLKNSQTKNSDWLDESDNQRMHRLIESYTWDYRYNASEFGGTRAALYGNALSSFMMLSGITVTDIFAEVNGYTYSLESIDHSVGDDSRKEIKAFDDMKIVGLFIQETSEFDAMIVNDGVYDAYKTWKAEQEKEWNADMGYTQDEPDFTEERVEHMIGNYAFVLAPITAGDEAAIEKLVQLSYADEDTTDFLYTMQNAVMYTLSNFNEIIEVLAQVFMWVGLGLALFSAFLLMNFISTSISYKKREIGILRAVGARSSDVFKIFFSEAFIIAFINFILAVAASVTAVNVLNWYMRSQGINITLLTFGPVQVAMMLAISVAVAALGAFLPVNAIARKKPVDAIKDR